jgi:hypothetical protein
VALLAIFTEFCTAKNAVIMINKNKKFIKESFSLHQKYVKNKFLNFVLKFHQIKTTKHNSIIIAIHAKLLPNNLNFTISHHIGDIFIIGPTIKTKTRTIIYIKKINSFILNLLNL